MSDPKISELQRQVQNSERRVKNIIDSLTKYEADHAKLKAMPYNTDEVKEACETCCRNVENTKRRLERAHREHERIKNKLTATQALEDKLASYTDEEKKMMREYLSVKVDP